MLGRRNTGQPPPVKELRQPQRRNSEHKLEEEVICPKEDNSNNLDSAQGDIEVATPSREREDNLEESHEHEEAEPCEPRDLSPTPLVNEEEGGAVDRPQRVRRPPAWL